VIAPLGLAVTLVGGAFLALAAPRLLPTGAPLDADQAHVRPAGRASCSGGFPARFVGARVTEIGALGRGGGRVVDVIQGDASLRRQLSDRTLEAGDTWWCTPDVDAGVGLVADRRREARAGAAHHRHDIPRIWPRGASRRGP
jgi:hypothetical protein